jgi:hypothetical protein
MYIYVQNYYNKNAVPIDFWHAILSQLVKNQIADKKSCENVMNSLQVVF